MAALLTALEELGDIGKIGLEKLVLRDITELAE